MARIIIAEDDDIASDILTETLLAAGHAVAAFPDGRQALQAMRFRTPHLAILDCNMPEMTGVEVLRAMRQSETLFRTPAIMLTARTAVSDERIARYEGANGYLTKPFHPDEVLVAVESMLAEPEIRTAHVALQRP